jgi:hypothetical protein
MLRIINAVHNFAPPISLRRRVEARQIADVDFLQRMLLTRKGVVLPKKQTKLKAAT